MKYLILNTDYPQFLNWLYAQTPGLQQESFRTQLQARANSFFGVADFYSSNLRKLGCEAWDIYANNPFIQKVWAQENDISFSKDYSWKVYLRRGIVPWIGRIANQTWMYEILAKQIKYYRPDVLLNQTMSVINSQFLHEMKPYVRLIVGQHAATQLSNHNDYRCYDLIISSFPPTLDFFQKQGLPTELHRLAFEPRVLDYLDNQHEKLGKSYDVTFIGNFYSGVHQSRLEFIEYLCGHLENINIWSSSTAHLSPNSPIHRCYVGSAWGLEMYQILSQSRITLNHHGDIPPYANNLRLYEATGVGALLVTDWKNNLPEMFASPKEVVTYHQVEACAELIQHYLKHEDERQAIVNAGQTRTLREHTYYDRMQELIEIVKPYLH